MRKKVPALTLKNFEQMEIINKKPRELKENKIIKRSIDLKTVTQYFNIMSSIDQFVSDVF